MNPSNARIQKWEYQGAPQTVALITREALKAQRNISVRNLVEQICKGLRSKDYLSEYLAIYHYVISHTRYMRDPRTVELVRAPYIVADELLRGGRPELDCDDMAALLAAMLLACGGQVRIVTVAFQHMFYRGERQYSHVFAQALEPRSGVWVTLDPVAGPQTAGMHSRTIAARIYPVA